MAGEPAGTLLVGHGSPDPDGRAELLRLRALVSRRMRITVWLGVLEFPAPRLPPLAHALKAASTNGRAVSAQPLILFDGRHGRHDLPTVVADASRELGVEVRLGGALGGAPALVALTTSRLRTVRVGGGDVLLFVGRGSSEVPALRQTERVAAAVAGELGIDHAVCYTGISAPDLAEGFAAALRHSPRRVIAVPYLLHTGILARRVGEILAPIAERRGVDLMVMPHLGNSPALVGLLAARLEELGGARPALPAPAREAAS